MRNATKLGLVVFFLSGLAARAQDSRTEFWPELNVYVNLRHDDRIVFSDKIQNTKGNLAYYYDLALKPILRRSLRSRGDVLRNRYLVFRAGYQYSTAPSNHRSGPENRGIVEATARYFLPWKIVLADRNRVEFRFIKGDPFSVRYRNRIWVERDLKIARVPCTPYAYNEFSYATLNNAWITVRYALGVQIPVGPHVELEPYVQRRQSASSTPQHLTGIGLKFNLYF